MALPDPSLVSPTIAVARMLPGLKRWLDRNRVEVTPIRVGPCQDRDLMTGQVIVDPLLIQKIQDWVRAISAKTIPDHPTAADVLDALDVLEKAVVQAQEVRSFLQQKIREISVFDRDPHREKQKKHDFIKELLSPERTIIRQAILGVLLRQADFRGPEDGGEPARPLVAEWEEIEGEPGGYKIHL